MLISLNKKRIIAIVIAIISLFAICISLVSCEKSGVPNGEYNVTLKLENAQFLRKITVRVQHFETGEVYDLEFLKKENYTKEYMLDFGMYKIVEIKPDNKDYEVEIVPSENKTPEDGFITNNSFTVAGDADFALNIKEIDTSGTLQWYIKNNAFTVCILLGCIIALAIVRWKKKTKFIQEDSQKMQ